MSRDVFDRRVWYRECDIALDTNLLHFRLTFVLPQRRIGSCADAFIRRSRRNCNPGRLFSQLCRSSSLELLFSCHFGLAAASVDTLRRSESSESTAAFGESRLFHQGASSPGHPGRTALRAADQADASQDEIWHHVQLYSLCGRFPAVSIESKRR